MQCKTFSLLADCAKVLALPAAFLAGLGGCLGGLVGMAVASASLLFLFGLGLAGAALALLVQMHIVSLRCPDCHSPMTLNPATALAECPNCRAAFWKNIVCFGYVRIGA
jgi:hypothetical protein